ncbi:hypothetical protein OG896_24810 [Streptomyces sp. NBC_00669]|uniref:hypothetical protein n=1 Tax=Streptomyces sp. NBC_00669 TaxID=2976011 RepID=UPI002E2ED915|nr:hypothetical protein [Streptomyces sp. NBC_00669]
MPTPVTLALAVVTARPTIGMRPIPAPYDPARLTLVPAAELHPGDLIVGDLGSRAGRAGRLRNSDWLCVPYVAQPGPFRTDCHACVDWMNGYTGPAVVTYPHTPEDADAPMAIIPAPADYTAPPEPCLHTCTCTCTRGFLPSTARYSPPSRCWTCHGMPCPACTTAHTNTH